MYDECFIIIIIIISIILNLFIIYDYGSTMICILRTHGVISRSPVLT